MPLEFRHHLRSILTCVAITSLTILFVPTLSAQQLIASSSATTSTSALPDAPDLAPDSSAQTATTQQTDPGTPQQTQRILGVMPNFRSVSADTKLPPQSAKDKFLIAGRDSFDYSSFLLAGVQAGFAMNSKSYPEFHQGVAGYGRYYWHTLADTAGENFMVGGVGPAIFHQDNRFYTLGHGSISKRALYAATRVLITRQDDGSPNFNYSEIIGSGAAAGISSLYYPTHYRDWNKVGQKWLTSCVIDSANFTFKEFWPDINHKLFHTK
jgi:hypothetical protein